MTKEFRRSFTSAMVTLPAFRASASGVMKKIALSALAIAGLASAAHATIDYQCDNYQGAQVTVTVFDEEGTAQVQVIGSSGQGARMETLSGAEVVSRMLWKFPSGALRACEVSCSQAARSSGIGSMG